VQEQGWYVDPYRLHEARWVSAGVPTALVRDGGTESNDAPPLSDYTGPLTPLPEPGQKLRPEGYEPGILVELLDFVTNIWPF
jgi:hypothetical protein